MVDESFLYESGVQVGLGNAIENDFVYASGQLVGDAGESNLAFIRGRGLGGSFLIDGFERGNLDPYRGDVGEFGITSDLVYQGDLAVEHTKSDDTAGIGSFQGDGLEYYPQRGDFFACHFYLDGGTANIDMGWGFESTASAASNHYVPQDGYYLYAGTENRSTNGFLRINRVDSQTDSEIISNTADPIPSSRFNEWLQFVVDWREDGYMEAYISAGDDIDNIVSGVASATDTTYSGESFWIYNDNVNDYAEKSSGDRAIFDNARRIE